MNKTLDLINGWAERLTIRVLHLFPKVDKEALSKVKEGFNQRKTSLDATLSDLKTKDPAKLSSYLELEKLGKILKWVLILVGIFAAWYYFPKILKRLKR